MEGARPPDRAERFVPTLYQCGIVVGEPARGAAERLGDADFPAGRREVPPQAAPPPVVRAQTAATPRVGPPPWFSEDTAALIIAPDGTGVEGVPGAAPRADPSSTLGAP